MRLKRYKLGELIRLEDKRNISNRYTVDDVRGISIQKAFIETKADMKEVSLEPYILVEPGFFAYVTVTSRNGEKITLAYNDTSNTYIVSSSYVVFSIFRTDVLIPEYLFMFFHRPEFDRYARFNSWGSARETFNWEDLCDIDIDLPELSVQQKYVSIYKAMVANQQSYERGLEDLKLVIDAELDKIKHASNLKPVSELLQEIYVRNEQGEVRDVRGINITKQFMPSVADINGVNLRNYKIVKKGQFAYSGMQTGRDECIRIALFEKEAPIIISPAYFVFEVKDNSVLAEYIMIWFSREESDRRGWFMSDASIRTNLDLDRFNEIKVPVPSITLQKALVDLYSVYSVRRDIGDRLKARVKDVCPILIKGSLEEKTA